VSNVSPITVRNGTISNFGFGVWAENIGKGVIAFLSDITVNNIVFHTAQNSAQDSTGVLFNFVNSSTISNNFVNSNQRRKMPKRNQFRLKDRRLTCGKKALEAAAKRGRYFCS
jgi:hypothetical protein